MSIVTKGGDNGFTDLPGIGKTNRRVRKDDPLIECLGALDELDAFCALAEVSLQPAGNSQSGKILAEVRKELFGAVMPATAALPAMTAGFLSDYVLSALNSSRLEQYIEELEKENKIQGFVRIWTKPASANLNAARTICRRAERCMTAVMADCAVAEKSAAERTQCHGCEANEDSPPESTLFSWLNRLSDLLFLLAVSEERK